ncbi:hypothetical protein AB0M83_48280, partial [Amycolatopsis sp. NPDC051106]
MKNALAYEWVRARSLRSTWLLLAGAGVPQFASGLYWGLKRDLGDLDAFTSAFGLVDRLGALLIAAIGVAASGLDHQHGTLATTRLVLRSPARIVAARALVTGGLGLLTRRAPARRTRSPPLRPALPELRAPVLEHPRRR